MATITCHQCGTQRHRAPSNTKLCRPCGLLRDVTYSAKFPTRTCNQSGCENEFAPITRADKVCGECEFSLYRGRCVWCEDPQGELVKQELPLCLRCVKKPGSKRRARLIQILRDRQDRMRAENGWTGPPPAPEEVPDAA